MSTGSVSSSRLSFADWFSFVSGFLGLVANVITLAGFASGLVEVPQNASFWTRPDFVSCFMLLFLALCMVLFGMGIIRKIKARVPSAVARPLIGRRYLAFVVLMYLVWVPTTVLWIFAARELNHWDFSAYRSGEDIGFACTLLVLFGGGVLAKICETLDGLFAEDQSD